jgi:YegS/Rv2252/BmrU family lipid kinase
MDKSVKCLRKILVLINPKSGLFSMFTNMRQAFDRDWERTGVELFYQFSHSKEDGIAKAKRAVENKFDLVIVSGGDGTVSTISRILVGTDTVLGVIPTGSGNGFARHFGIPLTVAKAVKALSGGSVRPIDVGLVNGEPFFVTCSMAWDAAIARTFEKSPVRGILPYVFAGVQEFFEYRPQDMTVELDDGESLDFRQPVIFTVANLTQYGGGAIIAPRAKEDDGKLELVVGEKKDFALILANLHRLFDGSIHRIPRIVTRSFQSMVVRREKADPIQVDGEVVDGPEVIEIGVRPAALKVLVPSGRTGND